MDLKVAFWNLQNLFDTAHDPISDDFEFTPDHGWTAVVQQAKVARLAQVIDLMFDGSGPDLLGVCEVENEGALQQLIDAVTVRNDLKVMHLVDGPDIRGIDCGLVYSEDIFQPFTINDADVPAPKGHMVHNRYPTRDILEVPLRVMATGAEVHAFVNHWPSRSQGQYETEPLRITAANHLGRLIDRRLKFTRQEFAQMLAATGDSQQTMDQLQARWNRNIIAMGDFNDEPYDRSVLQELQASSGLDKLEEAVKKSANRNFTPSIDTYARLEAGLFNCMWPLAATPDRGTHHYSQGVPTMNTLDQFIVSRGLYYGLDGLKMKRRTSLTAATQPGGQPVVQELATVVADAFDADVMLTSPQTRRPKEFTFKLTNGVASHNGGYSDHFPIQTIVETMP